MRVIMQLNEQTDVYWLQYLCPHLLALPIIINYMGSDGIHLHRDFSRCYNDDYKLIAVICHDFLPCSIIAMLGTLLTNDP